jgi:hypothetical protein
LCTYHGCPQRFETLLKLQKHKREAHRQTTPSGMTAAIVSRNSQAGPQKCTRVNPSTGKPCNSDFSRAYDLTRHEDTIHNARKMNLRCHLCQEEKTFSRNDALTRHMRVVHPEIDWPGKTRRKRKCRSPQHPLSSLSAPPCRVSEVDDENAEDRLMDNVITCGDEAYIVFTYQNGPSTPLKST